MGDIIIGTLLLAWFLTIFNLDELVINGIHELLSKNVTVATYYLLFLVGGFIYGILRLILLKEKS